MIRCAKARSRSQGQLKGSVNHKTSELSWISRWNWPSFEGFSDIICDAQSIRVKWPGLIKNKLKISPHKVHASAKLGG